MRVGRGGEAIQQLEVNMGRRQLAEQSGEGHDAAGAMQQKHEVPLLQESLHRPGPALALREVVDEAHSVLLEIDSGAAARDNCQLVGAHKIKEFIQFFHGAQVTRLAQEQSPL
eukprot:CAMPEP_0114430608 /NCGR_PEP_ID=MMETSP0103-20121206/10134_1 /TAXON_ID=37642 ORGANISM="Paraphysomonas imperforata, Strain PA2" /NCGR_SAMPLE_ID=MMETSP0103 /ASSEMBLY_ACC=CAM_ASM_000201 /LENGTH=112 /DNA_ID=CAMNT_0001600071 /DNA_START=846 /DNA_END=1184 /DNA_ORIENTATION=+